MKRLKRIYPFIVIAITAIFIASNNFFFPQPPNKIDFNELREEYPILNVISPVSDVAPITAEDIIGFSDTVILCEILENPQISEINLYKPGTPEAKLYEETKSYDAPRVASFYDYPVKVIEDLTEYSEDSESLTGETVTVTISSELSASDSVFTKGMRLILPVIEGSSAHTGKYVFTHIGAYYVLEDDTVLSNYKEDKMFLYDGKQLKQLKEEIKQLLKKQ